MKLLFKQRLFSWFDSYDIYDESENTVYVVKGQLSWGHCLKIFDNIGREVGMVKERIFTFMPKFELYLGENCVGQIEKKIALFANRYNIDCNGWNVDGDFLGWNYSIVDGGGHTVACISKELLHLTDTYIINVVNPQDALLSLMVVLAIDAEKCSRNNN